MYYIINFFLIAFTLMLLFITAIKLRSIKYQLSLMAGLDPSHSSIQAKEKINKAIKELSSKYAEETLNKQEYQEKYTVLVALMIFSIIWAILSIFCNVIYRDR